MKVLTCRMGMPKLRPWSTASLNSNLIDPFALHGASSLVGHRSCASIKAEARVAVRASGRRTMPALEVRWLDPVCHRYACTRHQLIPVSPCQET